MDSINELEKYIKEIDDEINSGIIKRDIKKFFSLNNERLFLLITLDYLKNNLQKTHH